MKDPHLIEVITMVIMESQLLSLDLADGLAKKVAEAVEAYQHDDME